MPKLWSYGDSHAAGHELGNWWSESCGREWLRQHHGFVDRENAIRVIGQDRYRQVVKEEWYAHLDGSTGRYHPAMSYAGELAQLLDYELVNYAKSGNSNSHSMQQITDHSWQWHRDDIVLFSVVTFHRYISASDPEKRNHQRHWLDPDAADIMMTHGPHDDCFKLQTLAYIKMVESMHPNVITLQTVSEDITVGRIGPQFLIRDSFTDFVENNLDKWDTGFLYSQSEDLRYPGGHFHEDCHKEYAKHIYESWL